MLGIRFQGFEGGTVDAQSYTLEVDELANRAGIHDGNPQDVRVARIEPQEIFARET